MLHIHNGDAAAEIARKSSLVGEHLTWRESLVTGPALAGLSAAEWRRVRAEHLSESYGVDETKCKRELAQQEAVLASFSDHTEVVLWFEHDLFCQLHLLYLLDWFSRHNLETTTLSMVCIGKFSGKENFRGVGELSPEELASLFPERVKVTSAQTTLAAAAWRAYCAHDPTAIGKVLDGDTSPLPFLHAALSAHLARFPSVRNGLGRIENCALELVAERVNSFADLFARFVDSEAIYGFGDAQFWLALRRLFGTSNSLLLIAGVEYLGAAALTDEIIRNAKFELTPLGHSVLKGEADFVALNGIGLWLGGLYLPPQKSLWRWNEGTERLVFT